LRQLAHTEQSGNQTEHPQCRKFLHLLRHHHSIQIPNPVPAVLCVSSNLRSCVSSLQQLYQRQEEYRACVCWCIRTHAGSFNVNQCHETQKCFLKKKPGRNVLRFIKMFSKIEVKNISYSKITPNSQDAVFLSITAM
jgi:hypothetical protein